MYENQEPEAAQLRHGHNKDFRPDCRQFVFGLNVTDDGHVPLLFNLFDGNQADDTTPVPNWEQMIQKGKKEISRCTRPDCLMGDLQTKSHAKEDAENISSFFFILDLLRYLVQDNSARCAIHIAIPTQNPCRRIDFFIGQVQTPFYNLQDFP